MFKSTDAGATWGAVNAGLPNGTVVIALAIDPHTPQTLYAAAYGAGVFKSTDGGATWGAANAGLPNGTVVIALAIDPNTPQILYAAGLGLIDTGGVFSGGVFAIEQISACVGDCNDSSAVTIDELLTMVNIALGNAQPSVCPSDPPIGGEINVAVIIQAVNNALKGCGAGE